MSKYPGRIISATPPTVSLSEASGVWTLEEAAQYQEAGTWPVAVPGIVADPNFNQTVLLLHGDGTNGAQNNTFLDGSTNNFTITRNGNTTQGTFSPFSGPNGYWSNFFDGNGGTTANQDRLTIADNAALELGSSEFCIEAWIYLTADPTTSVRICDKNAASNASYFWYINSDETLGFDFSTDGTNFTTLTSSASVSVNAWNHVAITRSGNVFTFWINGVSSGTSTNNVTIFNGSATFIIGNTGSIDRCFPGYISNFRLVVGSPVYTVAFTPSTTPLTAITNTSLLTCQSNRFRDASSNNFTVTRVGDARVTLFSPFAPSAVYDPAVNGGSGYFDGGGDYLDAGDNAAFEFGSGAFTIQAWIYPTSTTEETVISKWTATGTANSNSWLLFVASGALAFLTSTNGSASDVSISGGTVLLNSWNHVCVCRSGNTYGLFVNGSRVATTTNSNSLFDTSTTVKVGRYSGGGFGQFDGYIAGLQVVNGTAVFDPTSTTLTIPTALPTNITNTSLLLNFTNAGIFDQTSKNNLETVGDAQIDTTTKKYGTGSMEFDGTGDWLLMANTPDQQLGTGNFTIEFWVYLATGDIGSNRGLVAKGASTTGFLVSLNTTEKVVFTHGTTLITSTGAITTNAWNHIAVVREGTGSNQTKIYINGTNDGTGTVSLDFNQTSVMYVGCNRIAGDPMKGFIDDLRITKGVARYTTTFTPPIQAFSDF